MGKWGERVEKKCVGCGQSFYVLPNAKAQKQKYCSVACAGKEKRSEIVCIGCGVSFVPKEANRNKYCSRECAFSHKTAKAKEKKERLAVERKAKRERVCACCGRTYKAQSGVYCSDECRKSIASTKAYRRNSDSKPAENIRCKCCGKEFVPGYGDKRRVFCSDACNTRFLKRMMGGNKHRHKAKHYGVAYEPVNVMAVFARDGWVCQICGCKTPERLRGTTKDNAPELDHRVPMSKGGPHTYDNVQCACRRCNGAKGNTNNAGQMQLFNKINHIPGRGHFSVSVK